MVIKIIRNPDINLLGQEQQRQQTRHSCSKERMKDWFRMFLRHMVFEASIFLLEELQLHNSQVGKNMSSQDAANGNNSVLKIILDATILK